MRKTALLILLFLVALTISAPAQSTRPRTTAKQPVKTQAAPAQAAPATQAPNLEDITRWMVEFTREHARVKLQITGSGTDCTMNFVAGLIETGHCTLELRKEAVLRGTAFTGMKCDSAVTTRAQIPLGALLPDKVAVQSKKADGCTSGDCVNYLLMLESTVNIDNKLDGEYAGKKVDKTESGPRISFAFANQDDAERVARAFKDAIVACGGKSAKKDLY